ncbi:MAG: DUF721 domain-containing protein [bacterium]
MSARGRHGLIAFSSLPGEVRRTEPWGRRLARHRVFRVWEEAVGEALARVARPVSARGGRLVVEVADSAWLQELEMRREFLLARLNEALGGGEFEELQLRVGSFTPGERAGGSRSNRPPGPVPVRIAAEDEKRVEAALRSLSDSELRGRAERLLARVRGAAAVESEF